MTDSISTAQAAHQPGVPADGSSLRAKIKSHWVISTLVLVTALFLIGLIVRALSKPKAKPTGPQAIPVATAAVAVGDLDVYLDGLGTVTPVYTVTVVSRVAGEITEIQFREGQVVKKNDLLAVIDPRPYEAVLIQAQGQLARDIASLKNARIDLVRYQNAYKDHAIPQQELATQQATVDQDEGTVKLDQGNLEAAQVNVDYTHIRSPIDGRVGLRNIDPGNVVAANGTTGLCVITQLQPITVIFTIAEDEIDEVAAAMTSGRALQVSRWRVGHAADEPDRADGGASTTDGRQRADTRLERRAAGCQSSADAGGGNSAGRFHQAE